MNPALTSPQLTAIARLEALKELARNPAWEMLLLPLLRRKHAEHLAGLTNTNATPAERAEHLHAYHLAKEMDEWFARQTANYERQVRAIDKPAGGF